MIKPVIGVFAAAMLALALGGCSSDEAQVVGSSASTAEETATTEEQATFDLAIGTVIEVNDGLKVSVDSVEQGIAGYDGANYVKATVTYVNDGDESADFNEYDWKGEDADGAQEYGEIFMDADYNADDAALASGSLAAGGTKTGTLYFKEGTAKLLYFGNMLSDEARASWLVQ